MNRDIPCQAIVDPLPDGAWSVTVTGYNTGIFDHWSDCPVFNAPAVAVGPCDCGYHPQTRIYTIEQKTDNEAAMEGLRQFVEEMESRHGGGEPNRTQ